MSLALFAILAAVAAPAPAASTLPPDPYIWLEEVSSAKAMAWVEAHNAASTKVLQADARYPRLYDEALAIAAAKDRIPQPSFTHGQIYNFWQDADHLRGIWRKTSLEDYRREQPNWTTVLDIDALGKAEGKSWVLKDIDCLRPAERLCLISLSDGGEDAVEVREFDLDRQAFVAGGFHLPRGKHRVAWEDADHLLVASEWTPGDLTPSGYPYIVKRLTRGQPLSAAVEVYRGDKADGGYGVTPAVLIDGQGRRLEAIERPLDTFHHETWILTAAGARRLAIPLKVSVAELVDGRVIVQLDEAWTAGGASFTAGAVAQMDLAAVKADPEHLRPSLVWTPGPRESLGEISSTRDKLLLSILDNVRGRAFVLSPPRAAAGPAYAWTCRTTSRSASPPPTSARTWRLSGPADSSTHRRCGWPTPPPTSCRRSRPCRRSSTPPPIWSSNSRRPRATAQRFPISWSTGATSNSTARPRP